MLFGYQKARLALRRDKMENLKKKEIATKKIEFNNCTSFKGPRKQIDSARMFG